MFLSLFPALLNYPLFGILILRAALALVLIHQGYRLGSWQRFLALAGLALLIGLFTQAAALLAALILLIIIIAHLRKRQSTNIVLHLLIMAGLLAILFLGPGAFALDLPL